MLPIDDRPSPAPTDPILLRHSWVYVYGRCVVLLVVSTLTPLAVWTTSLGLRLFDFGIKPRNTSSTAWCNRLRLNDCKTKINKIVIEAQASVSVWALSKSWRLMTDIMALRELADATFRWGCFVLFDNDRFLSVCRWRSRDVAGWHISVNTLYSVHAFACLARMIWIE